MNSSLFQLFSKSISTEKIPEKFTFPFYYEPHELSIIAANELQNYLETQTDFEHNFGLDEKQKGLEIGKMFGVLVVRNQKNELGYLSIPVLAKFKLSNALSLDLGPQASFLLSERENVDFKDLRYLTK